MMNTNQISNSPEGRLLAAIDEAAQQMEDAVRAARAIGPEWENVVIDIQLPLLDQLSELRLRLRDRLAAAGGTESEGLA
ncbi:MAG TPA: hypothetical protein VFJ58_21065 [Armatimonadota bacterium]|nr:hypothetical protein [Armatimonadota bacterium]